MSEKFVNRYGKRILQRERAKTFEKTQHKSLLNIFHNEGISLLNDYDKSYIEKRYVETIYIQWKL